MSEKVILAGLGGQGMMLLGRLIAQALMLEGKNVTFFPSYGTEVRGGTAYYHLTVSEEEIFSPVIEEADATEAEEEPVLSAEASDDASDTESLREELRSALASRLGYEVEETKESE